MLFNSFEFLLFLPIVFLLYWFVFQKNLNAQNVFLLVVSYVFYGWWDWRFLGLIALSSWVDYWCGLKMSTDNRPHLSAAAESTAGDVIARRRNDDVAISNDIKTNHISDQNRLLQVGNSSGDSMRKGNLRNDVKSWFYGRKLYLTISLVFNLGLLGFFKYFNFFIESAADFISLLGFQAHLSTLNLILPVGISFYTFQTLSYSIDVYRGNLKASKDPIAFFTYVAFFPQLVAGPIERASNLLPQFFKKREFAYQQGSDGMKLILWGLFKKMVIADNCALVVNPIFDNYQTASGLELILGAVLFAFQIYGDFSGYSDIAIGVAMLFGFQLMTNFRTPYFSRDIAEFWRRWHISLSTWFRDYVYIPLGGSRVSKAKAIRNIFIVFLISGFWHGANWTFIAWGGIHAAMFIPIFLIGKNRIHLDEAGENRLLPSISEFFRMLVTFSLVCIAWIFFRAESMEIAWGYLSGIVLNPFTEGLRMSTYLLSISFILILLISEWVMRSMMVLNFKSPAMRYFSYSAVIGLILFYGVFFNPQDFIYFQF